MRPKNAQDACRGHPALHPNPSIYWNVARFKSIYSTCSSLVIFMYWACENPLSMQRQPRSRNNIPSFLQWTPPVARSFCEGCTWHHIHILVKAPLCCDWKGWAASVQSFPLSHQATVKIPRRAHLISGCSRHMDVVLHTHPIRDESHIHHNANWEAATLAAMLG